MEDMIEALQIYFSRANAWTPLWVTLKTGIAATFITFFTGLFAAARVMRLPSGKKAVADSILTLPIVLPPTVVGFVLLLLFSRNRLLGKTLNLAFGVVIPGTWAACVIAAVVISFPLMYRNTRAAFEQMDVTMIYAARTLGLSEWEIFWKISVPNALPGIASGTVLAFARAIGEYGATSMFAGNILGKTSTISQQIAVQMVNDNGLIAGFWSILIVVISVCVVFLMNRFSGRMNFPGRWG